MGLSNVWAQVQTDVTAHVPGTTFGFGDAAIATNDRPPRIVWVPTDDTVLAPQHMNSRTDARPLRTRNAGVAAHVWGATYDAAETLYHAMVASLHRTTHGSYAVTGAQWQPNANLDAGFVVVVLLTIAIPITDDAPPFVAPPLTQSFDTTGAVAGDGVLETGDP